MTTPQKIDVNDPEALAAAFRRRHPLTTTMVNVRLRPNEMKALDEIVVMVEAETGRKLGRAGVFREALAYFAEKCVYPTKPNRF